MKTRPKASQVVVQQRWDPQAKARPQVEVLVSPAKPKAPPPAKKEEPSSSTNPSVMEGFLLRFVRIRKLFVQKRTPQVVKEISDVLHGLEDDDHLPGHDYMTSRVVSQKDLKV
jgi:hypothetical protein